MLTIGWADASAGAAPPDNTKSLGAIVIVPPIAALALRISSSMTLLLSENPSLSSLSPLLSPLLSLSTPPQFCLGQTP